MNIKSMNLAWISISNFEQSKKFFTEVLGLTADNITPEYGWMELKGSQGGALLGMGVCSDKMENPVQPGNNAVMTMAVDDIVAAKAELEAKNVKIVGEIIEVPGHVKMVFFADPDGNLFQLVQQLGSCIE